MKKVIILVCLLVPTLAFARGAELYICAGKAVSNSVTDLKSNAWCLGQITPTGFGTWDFGYINEGHQNGDKRDGIYALPKFSYQLTQDVETSVEIGPYFTATTITDPDGIHYQDKYRWAAIGFAKVKYDMTKDWSVFGQWGHVMYRHNNTDSDLFLFGANREFN